MYSQWTFRHPRFYAIYFIYHIFQKIYCEVVSKRILIIFVPEEAEIFKDYLFILAWYFARLPLLSYDLKTIFVFWRKICFIYSPTIISFLIMNLFQIGLLFSLPVLYIHTYLPVKQVIDWFLFMYMTGCVKCHVYFSTFVFANERWFLCV
jgi:hypothetical protein